MGNKIMKESDDITKRASHLLKKLKAGTIAFEENIELDFLMKHDLVKNRVELGKQLTKISSQ